LLRLGLFAAIQLPIVCFVLMRGNPRDADHFYLAFHDKIERMDQTQGRRLLLVGGSNLAFGINSEALEGLGHAPINLGLHAGLGLDFYLRIVEERVRQGDIIVLCPEYELLSTEPNPSLQQSFVGHCPEFAGYFELPSAPSHSWKYKLDHQALTTINTWVRKAFKRGDNEGGVYSRKAFNEYGDLLVDRNRPRPGAIADFPVTFDPERMRTSIDKLNAFAKRCREQGAEVYYSYPPMPKERFAGSREALGKFKEQLDQELQIAQIDEPADHAYAMEQFFDTNYHLQGDAVTDRTVKLRESLETYRLANGSNPQRTARAGARLAN
jgi:hypothetical protein